MKANVRCCTTLPPYSIPEGRALSSIAYSTIHTAVCLRSFPTGLSPHSSERHTPGVALSIFPSRTCPISLYPLMVRTHITQRIRMIPLYSIHSSPQLLEVLS